MLMPHAHAVVQRVEVQQVEDNLASLFRCGNNSTHLVPLRSRLFAAYYFLSSKLPSLQMCLELEEQLTTALNEQTSDSRRLMAPTRNLLLYLLKNEIFCYTYVLSLVIMKLAELKRLLEGTKDTRMKVNNPKLTLLVSHLTGDTPSWPLAICSYPAASCLDASLTRLPISQWIPYVKDCYSHFMGLILPPVVSTALLSPAVLWTTGFYRPSAFFSSLVAAFGHSEKSIEKTGSIPQYFMQPLLSSDDRRTRSSEQDVICVKGAVIESTRSVCVFWKDKVLHVNRRASHPIMEQLAYLELPGLAVAASTNTPTESVHVDTTDSPVLFVHLSVHDSSNGSTQSVPLGTCVPIMASAAAALAFATGEARLILPSYPTSCRFFNG
eukprot:Filipodium_phascolosomae@DN2940_c0_g1_i1.p1